MNRREALRKMGLTGMVMATGIIPAIANELIVGDPGPNSGSSTTTPEPCYHWVNDNGEWVAVAGACEELSPTTTTTCNPDDFYYEVWWTGDNPSHPDSPGLRLESYEFHKFLASSPNNFRWVRFRK
jgi:hypothetical protein